MFNYILKKIVGTQNERVLKDLRPIVDAVNSFEDKISKLTDAELRAKTDEFRKRIAAKLEELKDEMHQRHGNHYEKWTDDLSPCSQCGKPADAGDYCYGCRKLVCPACIDEEPHLSQCYEKV